MTIIDDAAWTDVRADEDGTAPRLLADLTIYAGASVGPNARPVHLHVTAICVSDPEQADDAPYFQEAMNAEDQDDFDTMFQLTGASKPLEVVRIGGAGDNRTFVVYAEPWEG